MTSSVSARPATMDELAREVAYQKTNLAESVFREMIGMDENRLSPEQKQLLVKAVKHLSAQLD